MRSLDLFVGLVITLPVIAFAGTVWITDGAPFEPFEARATADKPGIDTAPAAAGRPPLPVGPATGVLAAAPSEGSVDADLDRLCRLARAGDREAVLLLTLIDGGRGRVAGSGGQGAGSRAGP